jgi:hypothetical protein
MQLEFDCQGVKFGLNLSQKVKKQNASYLTNSTRGLDGKLTLLLGNYISLKNRQKQFNELMFYKKNFVKPKSENLTLSKEVVKCLEDHFENITEKLHCSSSSGTTWKHDAFSSTLKEIPMLSLSGAEVGGEHGLGSYIYDSSDNKYVLPGYLMTAKGKFKDEIDVLTTLKELNPPLKRGNMIRAASGRYSQLLVVDPKQVSASNPAGVHTVSCVSLIKICWLDFKKHVMNIADNKLHTVLIARQSDHDGYNFTRVAEKAYSQIKNDEDLKSKHLMYLIDVSDNSDIIFDLDIKSLPVFAMFANGHMVYSGKCGGLKLPFIRPNPVVIVIEPDTKQQATLEKTLRKYGLETILFLRVTDALPHINKNVKCILVSSEADATDMPLLSQRVKDVREYHAPEILALVNVLGMHGKEVLRAAEWNEAFFTSNVNIVVDAPLAGYISRALQKPIKSRSVHVLATEIEARMTSNYAIAGGLTVRSLIRHMLEQLEKGTALVSRSGGGKIGIRLCAEDLRFST